MTFEEWWSRTGLQLGCVAKMPENPVHVAGAAWQAAQPNVEDLIRTCVPGGSICDPQQVADAIRDYFGVRDD